MSDEGLSKLEQRLVEYHKNSAASGRVGLDASGLPITLHSTGIRIDEGPNAGKFVSVPGWVPSVNADRPLTEGEAYDYWRDEIDQGLWPMYDSGEQLNNRAREIHRIMDMDGDIIKQNMGADGKQSIHVTPEEASLVDMIERYKEREGIQDFSAPEGLVREDFHYVYDPNNPPEFKYDKRRPAYFSQNDFKWADMRQLLSVAGSRATLDTGSPMGTSGLAYVDDKLSLSSDMRGNKTPEHLQRQQDDIRSYMTSEMSKNAMESYRASLPREMQDNLSGSIMIEQGRDGIYSLILGDEATGYTELSYGSDSQSYYDALSDAKGAFSYIYDVGDPRMNAGFWGRMGSAKLYGRRSERDLQEEMMHNYNEARRYMEIDRSVAAEALEAADMIGDEMKRRGRRPETNEHRYTNRVMRRDARRRAKQMMMD